MWRKERLSANESWSVDGANVIKSEYEQGLLEVTTYTDTNNDGVYYKASKSYSTGSSPYEYSTYSDFDNYEENDYDLTLTRPYNHCLSSFASANPLK